MSENRTIPSSEEAEVAVLACLVLDPVRCFGLADDRLTISSFHRPEHAAIFATLANLFEEGITIDLITITQRLEDEGHLTKIGGADYLHSLLQSEATSSNFAHYVKLLERKQAQRKILALGEELVRNAGSKDPEELIERAATALDDVAPREIADAQLTPGDHRPGWFRPKQLRDAVHELHQGKRLPSYSLGWKQLDAHYKVTKGQLCVIGGHGSSGKSELMDEIAWRLITLHGWRGAFASIENLPNEMHMAKLIQRHAGHRFFANRGGMGAAEIDEAIDFLQPFVTLLNPGDSAVSVDSVLRWLYGLKQRTGLDFAVLDPWNEFDHSAMAGQREDLYLSEKIKKIKRFAAVNEIAFYIVAHPRTPQKDKDGEIPVPTLFDLSGGAMWRNKADFGIIAHRHNEEGGHSPVMEVHVQKVRFQHECVPGCVLLRLNRETSRFDPEEGYVQSEFVRA